MLGGRGTDAAEVVLEMVKAVSGGFGVCGDSGDETVNAALGRGQDEEEAGRFEISAGAEAGLPPDMLLLKTSVESLIFHHIECRRTQSAWRDADGVRSFARGSSVRGDARKRMEVARWWAMPFAQMRQTGWL